MRPLKLFSADAHATPQPQVSPPPPGTPLPAPGCVFRLHFQSKVTACSWCVSAQTWSTKRPREVERHRETVAGRRRERASQRSGPLFLCLMRGALRRQLAGGCSRRHLQKRAIIFDSFGIMFHCQGALVEVRWSLPNLCLLGMVRRTRQSNCLSEVCGEGDLLRTLV